MNWCFLYPHYVTGGLETYVLRMCKYLKRINDSCFVACLSVSDNMQKQFLDVGTEFIYFDNWNRKNIAKTIDNKVDLVISFSLRDYYLMDKYCKHVHSFMYCVHPDHLTMNNREVNIIELAKSWFFRFYIRKGIGKGTLLVMDDNIRNAVKKKYSLSIDESEVFLLPYFTPHDLKKWGHKDGDRYSLLTICRADFPFKSYVLGLIDAVNEISNQLKVRLTIVSYGKDIDLIKRKIEGNQNISLLGEIDYNNLKKIYLMSDIYIGMGSTAIEAAGYGLPVILANVNSPSFLSCGYFCDNPQAIGEFDDSGKEGKELLYELLCNEDIAIDVANRCRDAFCKNYDIASYVEKIKEISVSLI